MSIELVQAIGTYIVSPICGLVALAIIFWSLK